MGRLLGNVARIDRNDNSYRLKKIVRRLQEDARGLRLGLEAVGPTSSDVGVHETIEIYCRLHMLCALR